ncbi:MAG: hypothetical protein ACUVWV_08825 [Thermodesulfobacteriota bacterium]
MLNVESFPESPVQIKTNCPQCSGEISFLEDRQVVQCRYCGSSLLIGGREGIMRYLLPAPISSAEDVQRIINDSAPGAGKTLTSGEEAFLFYAPYWRIQANVYRWIFGQKVMKGGSPNPGFSPPMERIKILLTRLMDQTMPAYSNLHLGLLNLGVRTQALPLQPLNQEHLKKGEKLLPLDISLDKVRAEAVHYANIFFEAEDIQTEVLLQQSVGEKFSIIYSPIWFCPRNKEDGKEVFLIDAIGKKIISIRDEGETIINKLRGKEKPAPLGFSEIIFLPLRCPNCGWPFPYRPFSYLHFCQVCRRLWGEKKGVWEEIKYKVFSPPAENFRKDFLWVPFWRWQVSIVTNNDRLETMMDLYRLAPPPRVIDQQKEKERPIYFYIPAVKFRDPKLILNIASRLTYSQPPTNFTQFPDGHQPVTIGGSLLAEDSRNLGFPILGFMVPSASRPARNLLKNCQLEMNDPEIFYIPFQKTDLFLKESSSGLAFQYRSLPEDLPTSTSRNSL